MKNIFFTSDTHIGHEAILRHQAETRKFTSLVEHDEAIIVECNAVVKRGDLLVHCGDFFWRASNIGRFRQRLAVRELHVVRGNHDAASLRRHVSSFDYMLFRKFGGVNFHFTHYPIESWSADRHGCIHIHGHSHGASRPMPGRFDVGVDVAFKLFGKLRPFALEEILELYQKQDKQCLM